MRIWKSRAGRIPRSIERRMRRLRANAMPKTTAERLTKETAGRVDRLGPGVDAAAAVNAYVTAHLAEWALQVKAEHNELRTEIGWLAAEASALVEQRRILCEDQRDLVDDLDAAVTHALERVTDPDSPYHEPIRRSERKGGKR